MNHSRGIGHKWCDSGFNPNPKRSYQRRDDGHQRLATRLDKHHNTDRSGGPIEEAAKAPPDDETNPIGQTSNDEEDQRKKSINADKQEEVWVAQVQRQERRLGEERKHNRNLCFVYHVMNSTYIDMRTGCPIIYMHMKGKIYKEPLKKYNNGKG
jgi:hypothetical protein